MRRLLSEFSTHKRKIYRILRVGLKYRTRTKLLVPSTPEKTTIPLMQRALVWPGTHTVLGYMPLLIAWTIWDQLQVARRLQHPGEKRKRLGATVKRGTHNPKHALQIYCTSWKDQELWKDLLVLRLRSAKEPLEMHFQVLIVNTRLSFEAFCASLMLARPLHTCEKGWKNPVSAPLSARRRRSCGSEGRRNDMRERHF